LIQPALRCGYRFEDESVVEEMLEEVSRERGALPLLGFSAQRLWDGRDRQKGYLTRDVYEQIGGISGALARHAEATLERVGADRFRIVRELFRNLVTAQGTRVARSRAELLSVFDPSKRPGAVAASMTEADSGWIDRSAAEEVLGILVDARLLTSYEVSESEGEAAHHRIEIIHESLLTSWPRLVRWQMQDAEGAKLRDELRHQARGGEGSTRRPSLDRNFLQGVRALE
jgi:hypothetical protein